ncbi:MAG: FAD-binding oxidoreductase [Mariprofundaceae bacterium]|nr:FAD-binding oxidoreductase [Mariprofundaceae bacterium]
MLVKTLEGIEFKTHDSSSILESGLNAGHVFAYSCKNGQCGVCKTTLLEGDVVALQEQIALTEADKKNKKILTCCCAPKTDILIDVEELSLLKDIEIKTLPARIKHILKITDQIVDVELRLPPTAKFNFLEGQYIEVIGSEGIRRSYSIANCANEKTIKLFIKKVEHGVLSQYWFHEAKANDLLRIEGPKGSFFFRGNKKNIIFMATGTGIAPVKSILDKLAENPKAYSGINFSLYWGNRNVENFFWTPNYNSLHLNYIPVLSQEHELWHGRIGYIQDSVIEDALCLENTQVYACGSMKMIQSASALLVKHGLEEKQFYSDAFVSS